MTTPRPFRSKPFWLRALAVLGAAAALLSVTLVLQRSAVWLFSWGLSIPVDLFKGEKPVQALRALAGVGAALLAVALVHLNWICWQRCVPKRVGLDR